jgi:predicted  nucleic acid-binding Zn-ribbon protein
MLDDKVKIRCPRCTKVFKDRAQRVRSGYQVNCEHCNHLLTMSVESEDPHIRRALKTAKEVRAMLEDAQRARMTESAGLSRHD